MKPSLIVLHCAALIIAGCSKTASSDGTITQAGLETGFPSGGTPWEEASVKDSLTVREAKRACSAYPRRKDSPPTPGGSDPFTNCMKQLANKNFGQPAFEEICTAIPGAEVDDVHHACVTLDL